jgi:hypothetical protein
MQYSASAWSLYAKVDLAWLMESADGIGSLEWFVNLSASEVPATDSAGPSNEVLPGLVIY